MRTTSLRMMYGMLVTALLSSTLSLSPAEAVVCTPGFDQGSTSCGLVVPCAAAERDCATIDCQPRGVPTTWTVKVKMTDVGPLDTAIGEMFCGGSRVAICTTDFSDLDRACAGSGGSRPGSGECRLTFINGNDGIRPRGAIQCTDPLVPWNVVEGTIVYVDQP